MRSLVRPVETQTGLSERIFDYVIFYYVILDHILITFGSE